ncbi:MAG: TIGR00269 family protein [Thermoplasmatales archaeon]|jgi:TIGR00269 family protein
MKCSFCERDAIIHIRYNGTHLCKEHFNRFLEKRVRLEFRNQLKIENPIKIVVALSGGKDSSVALYLTKKILGKRRDVKIEAVTIDEGISGYRSLTLEAAKKLTDELKVKHEIISFRDKFGVTIDEISKNGQLLPCSYCGVFRRKSINDVSIELNADYVVTGLNLDDSVQTVIMNMARGDLDRLERLGPHFKKKDGMIPRLQPLRKIPEREVLTYAIVNNIPFSHAECPYAIDAIRNEFREAVDKWEERTPGTKFAILNSFDEIRDLLYYRDEKKEIKRCKICGAPSAGEICKSCSMLMDLKT